VNPAEWAQIVAPAMLRLAVGTLGLALFVVVLTPVQAARDQAVLYGEIRAEIADPGAPVAVIPSGEPIALLAIPSLGLGQQVIVEGTTSADLASGVGHRRDSVLPGQAGLSVLYGRRAAYGGPFRDLTAVDPGAAIEVVTPDGSFVYRVDRLRRGGDPIPAREPGGTWLMLVTADGEPFMPTESIYVDATLVQGTPLEPTTRVPVTPDEAAMAPDPDAWLSLLMWLQALVAALVGMTWVRHRLGRRESLVMGLPVVLAVVWNVYEATFQLFPNLL
jgi:sortase A